MSSEQLIPNAVGRLDDVTDAIRRRDDREALRLLWERGKQVEAKRNEYQRLSDNANAEMRTVLDFAEAYSLDPEFRKNACAACGGDVLPGDA